MSEPAIPLSASELENPFKCLNTIISFSYDCNRTQHFDDSAKRYYADPPIGAQLSYGYDTWDAPRTEDGRLDDLLRAIRRADSVDLPQINVIAWRGLMTRIMVPDDDCEFDVMIVNDVMYLEEHISDEKRQQESNMPEHQRKATYYGQAFFSYATSQTPSTGNITERSGVEGGPPGWGGAVKNHLSWCHVVDKELGGVRLLLGGEIHCTRGDGQQTGTTESFVQLKTSLPFRIGTPSEKKHKWKLIKAYTQSLLLGTPEIIMGFRSPSGQLRLVESLKTADIPELVGWDAHNHDKWWAQIYGELRKGIVHSHAKPKTVWRVKFDTGNVHVGELTDAGEDSDGRVGFLPRWYWDELGLDV